MAAKRPKRRAMPKHEKAPKKLCFVIGPVGESGSDTRKHANWLLEGIIQPIFDEHFQDFKVERADRIDEPGSISSQITIRLHTAELVIADMSLANANAFYEMGIRHMKRLPTIHMFLEGESIPFDVKPDRAISFKYDEPSDLKAAQVLLRAAVEEVMKPNFVVDNPVTRARGLEKLEETATPEQRVFLEQLQQMGRRLDSIESRSRRNEDIRFYKVSLRDFKPQTQSKVCRLLRTLFPEAVEIGPFGPDIIVSIAMSQPEFQDRLLACDDKLIIAIAAVVRMFK
jgi:hypothetical protein